MTASLKSIVARYWFAVSTYKIPLFTTVPTNIKKPSREVMLIGQSTNHKNRKEPIRANGIVVITMMENFGDSNCAAITTNTRNTAVAIACPRDANSSFIIFVDVFSCMEIVPDKYLSMTSFWILSFVVLSAPSVRVPVMVT